MIELNGENYLDGHEASHLLGVKLSTLYSYVSRGMLKSYKQGIKRQRLYKKADIDALLEIRPSDDVPFFEGARRHGDDLPHAEDWVPNI